MQRELALNLRDERDEARVVRPRRYFREPDLVALDEQLDAEDAVAAERRGHSARHVTRLGERGLIHLLRLPGFDIVAVELHMADRFAEMRAVGCTHRQLRDLEVECDLAFDDD